MEAKDLIKRLKAELTCSICLGYFTDPVTALKCGHTFCKDCLLQCDEQADATLTCPECRAVIRYSDVVLNENLQNLSITGKTLRQHLLLSPALLTTCDQHGEKEKLFCEQDQKLICESCLLTQEHKDHQDLPLQMAADKCKKKLQETLNVLQEKEEELKAEISKIGKEVEYFKKDTDFYKEVIKCEYRKMHEILYIEENRHLQKLDQEREDKLAKVEANKAKLSQQIQHVQQKILEIEESLDEAPLEMLQDMKGILERNELQLQETETVNLTYTIYPMTGLIEILRSYQTGITVDPEIDTLHLIVPEHYKSLKYRLDPRNQPDKEERLDYFVTVLGTETFTSGKHYWEVDVEGQTEWVLGICEDSVSKNENVSILSEDVKAIIGSKVKNQGFFWSSEGCFSSIPPCKMGVFLDYDEGNITFYDVHENIVLIGFLHLAFRGPVRPFFSTSFVNKGSSS